MTVEISRDPWETLDRLLGVEVAEAVGDGIGAVAFYGRCSTEDNQDPETSHGWQLGNARKFVEPLGGHVVVEFFDVGQSRSVPWERRPEAARLLAQLKNPQRGWSALVVGEGTRCWFGNQFSLIAPRFAAYGVELWVPELGGRFEPRNPSHKMLMSVLGGMSESERQHVQARVRAAMDSQVVNEGRHQGGRAPYGYVVVDGGPHPNPRKAAEGYRLRKLAVEEASAEVVRRIFAEYLSGRGDRAIATGLNRDAVPCPSARRPDQNPHRLADGWQGSTVRAILDNPRYTGFAFFGRWTRQEMLLDPDDVAAGHVVRFRRATADKVVRSRKPAHPAIVGVEEFTQVQLLRKSKSAGGLKTARKAERSERPTKRPYLFRGRVRCTICGRKMEASPRARGVYYRCPARTLAPGAPALAEHPPTVYLREDVLQDAVNGWLGGLFAPQNLDRTVAALVASQEGAAGKGDSREAARLRLSKAEEQLSRFQEAIKAGIDPLALVEAVNEAQAVRTAAKAELEGLPVPNLLGAAEVHAMIDSLGNVGAALKGAGIERVAGLYTAVDLQVRYTHTARRADVIIKPAGCVNNVRVRGGT
ncbi:recombinase family protein [Actinosynnema pretiosum]|uniref:Recombinase family protein n=1 Tax=Actinosynnema pretiosum TaxID=42197 RepID=A0A290Z9L6_9PSEU|nr:recombinase family protein [Actinosynnema pretiosum]ATE55730.1 recombinase family protein [Actinosynnema pretiosum]